MAQLEKVYGLCRRGDAKQGRRGIERHAENPRWHRTAPELVQLVAVRNGEDADYGSLVRSGSQQSAITVERNASQRRPVCFNHINRLQL